MGYHRVRRGPLTRSLDDNRFLGTGRPDRLHLRRLSFVVGAAPPRAGNAKRRRGRHRAAGDADHFGVQRRGGDRREDSQQPRPRLPQRPFADHRRVRRLRRSNGCHRPVLRRAGRRAASHAAAQRKDARPERCRRASLRGSDRLLGRECALRATSVTSTSAQFRRPYGRSSRRRIALLHGRAGLAAQRG